MIVPNWDSTAENLAPKQENLSPICFLVTVTSWTCYMGVPNYLVGHSQASLIRHLHESGWHKRHYYPYIHCALEESEPRKKVHKQVFRYFWVIKTLKVEQCFVKYIIAGILSRLQMKTKKQWYLACLQTGPKLIMILNATEW